jgi:hypothetical protein
MKASSNTLQALCGGEVHQTHQKPQTEQAGHLKEGEPDHQNTFRSRVHSFLPLRWAQSLTPDSREDRNRSKLMSRRSHRRGNRHYETSESESLSLQTSLRLATSMRPRSADVAITPRSLPAAVRAARAARALTKHIRLAGRRSP